MLKNLIYTTFIVCILSILSVLNVSYAGTAAVNDWQNAQQKVWNAEVLVDEAVSDYHTIRSDVETLSGEWSSNTKAIEKNESFQLTVSGKLIVTGLISALTTNPAGLVPAAYTAYMDTWRTSKDTKEKTAENAEYMTAMSTLISLMDTARSNIDAAYSGGYVSQPIPSHLQGVATSYTLDTIGYDAYYDRYLAMAQTHIDGYDDVGVLESSVKMGKLSGYYHKHWHLGDLKSNEDHVFIRFLWLSHWNVKDDLEKKYKCNGVCGTLFRTPYEAYSTNRMTCSFTLKVQDVLSSAYRIYPCPGVWYSCERSLCPLREHHLTDEEKKKYEQQQTPQQRKPQQQVTPQEQQTTPSTSPSAPNTDPPPEPQTPEKELCKWCKMYGIKDGCGGSCIN